MAVVKVSVSALVICLLINAQLAYSATFMVGDTAGWIMTVGNWPDGKTFNAGDILEFKYNPMRHNVVVVDEDSYNSCTVPTGAQMYQTGDDKITLVKGKNFFICGIPGHCNNGMKIAVTAN